MYEIWAGNLKIYDDELQREELKLLDPKLTMEDNSAGSLEFSMPPTNIGYGDDPQTNKPLVARMTTYISVRRNGSEIWAGRVLTQDADFYNNRTLMCEGELAYFNDSAQPVAEYTNISVGDYLKALIAKHNARVDSARQFTIDSGQIITVTGTIDVIYTNYEKTIDCLGGLIEQHGGHFRIRKTDNKRYLDYLADYPHTANQTINFGENLLEFTRNWDESNFATVVIPLGASLAEPLYEGVDEKLTIATVNSGKDYLENATTVAKYGRIERVVNWDDEDNPTKLKQKGQTYLNELQFDKMTIELSALDLHYLNVNDEAIDLLDVVRVVSPPHAMDMTFPVTRLEIPLDHPESTKFTLNGNAVGTLTSMQVKNIVKVTEQINSSEQSAINKSGVKATALVNKATTGYITITRETLQNPNGTDALYITDSPNISTSLKMWKWDLGGLSYSSRTSTSVAWGTPSVAMNMDGSIVADRITTGTLKSQNNNFSLNLNDGTLTMKKGSINIGSNAFKVDTDGSVTITKGSLSIGANDNFKVTSTGDVTIKNGNIALTQGSININDKFVVSSTGSVTITEGTINVGVDSFDNPMFSVNALGEVEARKIILGGAWTIDASWRPTSISSNYMSISEDGVVYFFETDHDNNRLSYLSIGTYRSVFTRGWPESGPYIQIGSTLNDQTDGFGIYNDSYAGLPKLYYARQITQNFPVSDRWYFGCDIDGSHYTDPLDHSAGITKITAYNLLLDPNTSGAVGGPSTTYAIGDSKLTVKNGFITGYSQYNYLNHRNNLHGSSLGSTITAAQKKAIWNGTFSGLYVGDYWTINGVDWQIVDMDYWYNSGGGTNYQKHHLVIMPKTNLYVAKMNNTATNATGYSGSKMYTDNLADAKTAINTAFPNLVLSHQDYLADAVTSDVISATSMYTIDVDLPSEIMIYGTYVMANKYDQSLTVSTSRSQLAYFRLNPRFDTRQYSWLKDPAGSTRFCCITTSGYIAAYPANNSNPGVRPIFAMGPASDPG